MLNPIPALAPDGEYIAMLTPIKRPRESSNGPPEFFSHEHVQKGKSDRRCEERRVATLFIELKQGGAPECGGTHARIDRRIALYATLNRPTTNAIHVPAQRRHDAGGEGVIQSERIAYRQYALSHLEVIRGSDGDRLR